MSPILVPPPAGPATPLSDRDVRLGPLRFPTVNDQVKEALGDTLETVGALAIPGERRPRPFSLSLPVHAMPSDGARYLLEGDRLRAQVRALIENSRARLQGLWFSFAADPQVDCWLLVGGADLSYTEQGVTFADYVLELTDCYRIGDRNTHRPSRRLEVRDRRLSTTPRDILGRVRSTDFASRDAFARHFFPVGSSDFVGTAGPLQSSTLASIDGDVAYIGGRPDKDTVTFELDPDDEGKGDVKVLDRRGALAPAFSLAGDADPEDAYFWEALYGIAQKITDGDVPVLQNGLCRVRYIPATAGFAFDTYSPGVGYVELCRVTAWRDYPAGTEIQYAELREARLVEWTPDRAVVRAAVAIDDANRCDVYVTLQRGWSGPRFEAYGSWSSGGKPGTVLRVTPAAANLTALGASTGGLVWGNGSDYGPFGLIEPWMYLASPAGASVIHVAVLQGAMHFIGRAGTAAYASTRNGVSFAAQYGSSAAGYASITLGAGPVASAAADAQLLGKLNLYDSRQIPWVSPR